MPCMQAQQQGACNTPAPLCFRHVTAPLLAIWSRGGLHTPVLTGFCSMHGQPVPQKANHVRATTHRSGCTMPARVLPPGPYLLCHLEQQGHHQASGLWQAQCSGLLLTDHGWCGAQFCKQRRVLQVPAALNQAQSPW